MNDTSTITYAIVAYNQSLFIEEAIYSALNQNLQNIRFIFSDDCSSDNTFELMKRISQNFPHKDIFLNRNKQNLGLADHVNKILSLSKSEIILLAAGDDISLASRAGLTLKYFKLYPEITCLSFDAIKFHDEKPYCNNKSDLSEIEVKKHTIDVYKKNFLFHMNGCARSYRKSSLLSFGNLNRDTPSEDSTSLLRCLLSGPVLEIKQPQVFQRIHGENIYASENKFKIDNNIIFNQYINDIYKALELNLIDEEQKSYLIVAFKRKLKFLKLKSDFQTKKNRLKALGQIIFMQSLRLKVKIRFLTQLNK